MRPAVAVFAVLAVLALTCAAAEPAAPFAAGNARNGESKSAPCASCHGANGNSANPQLPRLAGQSGVYIAEQLRLFRSGARNSSVMQPVAAALSDQDIDDLAVYYEVQAQPPALAAAPEKPAAATADERLAEQQLRLQGYKLSMVRGEQKYCRREAPLGSRLGSQMHCVTVAEAELMAKEGRETTERIQRTAPGCLSPAMGGCGK